VLRGSFCNVIRFQVPAAFCYDLDMKTAFILSAFLFAMPSWSLAAEQTWSGKISDSACGAKHEEAAEGQGVMADRDCTQACVRGGSKYVLVVDGKVFQIANQDDKDLATHAGHAVKMTGELKGNAITVTKIEM
jgi:hypothetical protein